MKFIFWSLLFLPLTVFAYASPGKPSGFVSDFAGMFTADARAVLEEKLSRFARASGNEIVVAAVATLGGDTIENFAEKLFQEWGVGKKGEDNGALILIARDEREVRIEVGYGLEPLLTDAAANAIIRTDFAQHFAIGDFAGGLNAGIDRAIEIVASGGANASAPSSARETSFNSSNFFFFLFFIPLWLASILGRSKSWWAGGVVGGIAGVVLSFIFGFLYIGFAAIVVLIPVGLLFDFIVSRAYAKSVGRGMRPPWWIGGGGGHGGFGGGFGGFGGGSSGGGGASGSY
ncbi:MAG: hypothetical protein A3C08_01775 [Candidatus Taylorbacteria bacterium RIFCSPHIGHO2_02_FULL_47_18]|uniref:TPM domain-containing protein n=1 Tax=Candidatus Taylorbacteria bacterium RIFCSPLOWO2_01_FULL_48_100 TaxID=1802322 RepID=A0A1G2NHQ3_9BACT|nr:MAG: hypothetical protein A2670_02035 [Candidatus Taylorbacteria bacterium RIFCSPHIGHO2_01_FULL_48_38]OHA28477.1 MAG: hypothetical protein A3C08_01775 [Candidatus Taylorbacteria bacterium RIFCSPHIGHO2_02_FULL_47_18]OHA34872.1 MAG: hypothetical protein A2938_00490 [Candidatus Taylorbacteria bacterium RIFCSPLOWO2_01_FULL_48_100]OHA40231.1 MAG: hypothetical protein A3J31_01480 [Candidatus Taylorbacteria bacterium RIFCSPLOWO2_02_FULL_48_16]OHA45435.1 MAG: hypothetical protein A3H13_01365 [Candid